MPIFDPHFIETRQTRAALEIDAILEKHELLLVYSGAPIGKPGGLDQTYTFLPHPDYFWLTGLRRARGVVAYTKDTGWVSFVEQISPEEVLWEGGRDAPEGEKLSDLSSWIRKFGPVSCIVLGQPTLHERSLYGTPSAPEHRNRVQEALNRVRRTKDAAEIQLVERAARAAAAAYKRLKEVLAPGVSERFLKLEYEHAALMAGADGFPYDTLVGSGTNASILHALPTHKKLLAGELVLVDAGAEIHDYCVDITRTFAVGGEFNARQKAIYDLVFKSQLDAISFCRPGVEWLDVHTHAARVLADGLKDLGLMKGETDSLLETGAISVFLPHGVGHMVGLRVRDVGPRLGAVTRTRCGVKLRVDFPLEEGFLMTVEPGLYFISPLLNDPELRKKHRDQIQWDKIEAWKDVGGVRLEDDILITKDASRNLTALIEK